MAETVIDEPFPEKPSLRSVQTPNYGKPREKQFKVLQDISRSHVDSFNYMLNEGLRRMAENVQPLEMGLPNDVRLKVQISNCKIEMPFVNENADAKTIRVYPAECRSRVKTYKANCVITVLWSFNDVLKDILKKTIGKVPVMVKSEACNLNKMSPKELVAVGEEENEFGGYFIINGIERVFRQLIMQRRNYPIAMERGGWKKRGDLFTEYGVSIRCVRPDQSGSNLVLHYLSDGTAKLMFTYKKKSYFVPVMLMLKALVNDTDRYFYNELVKTKEEDIFYKRCITNMLRKINSEGIIFHFQALHYLGEKFAVTLDLPDWYTPENIAQFLIQQCICVHLESNQAKFDLLVFMIKKLFSVVKNDCCLETPDNPMNQEVLLPGHLYMLVLKEKLHSWLNSVKFNIDRRMRSTQNNPLDQTIGECFRRTMDISKGMENVLATGNFSPKYENSLMQFTGLVVVADKLNYWRYISHFRAIHRGAFFAQMRTTAVRKLLPEAWGFLCPVHTPDGTPCGLLNHMSSACEIVNDQPNVKDLLNTFCQYGLIPYNDPVPKGYTVIVDGRVVGWLHDNIAFKFVQKMRKFKSLGEANVPKTLEICLVPKTNHASQYPGLFVFTSPARMMRPVKSLLTGQNELVGTMEQVYMHIAVTSKDKIHGVTFHQELCPTNMLSILGNQVPYSDCNQSPRNIYECQMGKQTMGTPCHALKYRSDNKLYRLVSPQSPIVRPKMHDHYHMDDYPLGTNAIVAVISYSGYDMEDAIILNKSSVERGFNHGVIYKTQVINLRMIAGDRGQQKTFTFGRQSKDSKLANFVDEDGLPYIGTRLNHGDPVCSYIDNSTGETKCINYDSQEEAYVEDVKLLGNDTGSDTNQQISIKYCITRNPIVGDKFASRHGQKGICSMLMPAENMPFTEGGMTPDIIFNPHGFPSRMTIGMMVEVLAGKYAAHKGVFCDATPFQFSESETAISYFGECLKEAGFDYYGTEKMYSGINGMELKANIFMGVVYYQRLRHMVADKYQVRTTGPVDALTRQPVKGRKRDGGVRFGEMERDSLLAHGSAGLLYDRLFTCSDGTMVHACKKCQSLISPVCENLSWRPHDLNLFDPPDWMCQVCGTDKHICKIDIPYVFKYLVSELAVMNIKVKLTIEELS